MHQEARRLQVAGGMPVEAKQQQINATRRICLRQSPTSHLLLFYYVPLLNQFNYSNSVISKRDRKDGYELKEKVYYRGNELRTYGIACFTVIRYLAYFSLGTHSEHLSIIIISLRYYLIPVKNNLSVFEILMAKKLRTLAHVNSR